MSGRCNRNGSSSFEDRLRNPCCASSSPGSPILIPTFLGVTLVAFGLIRLIPGDPIQVLAGERGIDARAPRPAHGRVRPRSGRSGSSTCVYLGGVLQGDLGRSIVTKRPVLNEFMTPVPGDGRAVALRHAARRPDRPAGRRGRRRQARLGVRPRPHGHLAHRLLDADLLVGPAADHPVLGHPAVDAGLRAHLAAVLLPAGDRLHADRQPARRPGRRVRLGRSATSSCRPSCSARSRSRSSRA